jgi:hypothetical protein
MVPAQASQAKRGMVGDNRTRLAVVGLLDGRYGRMTFEREISRKNPTCFLFLVDQSDSMSDPIGGTPAVRKAEGLADVLNRTVRELCLRNRSGNEVFDRVAIGVIGYGEEVAAPILGGALKGRTLVPVSEVSSSPLRVETRTGKEGRPPFKVPIWVDPAWHGSTPMCKALNLAHEVIDGWIKNHPHSYPPMVINITDGEATDGDPQEPAAQLMALKTSDGNAQLWNIHISSATGASIWLPNSPAGLPDEFAQKLFSMSSILPEKLLQVAQREFQPPPDAQARGFAFNSGLEGLVKLLDIGTRPPTALR